MVVDWRRERGEEREEGESKEEGREERRRREEEEEEREEKQETEESNPLLNIMIDSFCVGFLLFFGKKTVKERDEGGFGGSF